MRTARVWLVGVVAAVVLSGCMTARERMLHRLGPAAEVGSASIDNLGWQRDGNPIDTVRFTAIVTTYDETGTSYTDRQEMVVALWGNRITAVGGTPQGAWEAVADDSGSFELAADAGVDRARVTQRMAPTLATLMHRMRGPYNLLRTGERARTAQPFSVGGQSVVRVAVAGDNRKAVAYYFDGAGGILKFVTAGADSAGKDGTVTEYQYRSLPDGVAFPSLIREAKIGTHVLVGGAPVFEVEISDVSF